MSDLPIREMVLYKHGVGYFVRSGKTDSDSVTLTFNEGDINDILKSLSVFDRTGGKILGIDYQTPMSREQRLANSTINLSDSSSQRDLLRNLRGRAVQLTIRRENRTETIKGYLAGIEIHLPNSDSEAETTVLLLTDENHVRFFAMSAVVGVAIDDIQSVSDLSYFLDVVKNKDSRQTITIRLTEGSHDLEVRYVAPSPTWRVSYRVVARSDEGSLLLQGWGLFDNQLDEELEDVKVTLVAGQPISFIYDLYKSTVPERPTVTDEVRVVPRPVEYKAEVGKPTGGGNLLRRIESRAMSADSPAAAAQPAAGRLEQRRFAPASLRDSAAPIDDIREEILRAVSRGIAQGPDEIRTLLDSLLMEQSIVINRAERERLYESLVSEVLSFAPEETLEALAEGEARGEFFQYTVTTPVSAGRGASTLVPIISTDIEYEKELLYNGEKLPDHPTVALRFKNTSSLTLERGPVTIVEDGDYKGEAIVPYTHDDHEVYLPFAVELGVNITEKPHSDTRTTGLHIRKGFVVYEQWAVQGTKYVIENTLDKDITLTLEARLFNNYELFDTPEPDVETATERRWRIEIPARSRKDFVQMQRTRTHRQERLEDLQYIKLQQFLNNKWINDAIYDELKQMLDLLRQVHTLENEQRQVASDKQALFEEQKQQRENLQALSGGNEDEAPLRARVLAKLSTTQDRLDAIEEREAELKAEMSQLRDEIESIIKGFDEAET
ncbi:MAG: hypothetical protein L0154_11755 [Chloroflexi bacterium]|nr:hypothetical protein [Chloroflexota bacterium]